MPNATWKEHERRTARVLGGRRVGPAGVEAADVVVGEDPPWLVVECKHRKRLPQWLKNALEQAQNAAGAGQLGIAVLHERGRRDSLVVLSLSDFADWFGNPPEQR
jgi:hypothetical protein